MSPASSTTQSGDRDPIAAAIATSVDEGTLAGAATLVWRGGKVIQTCAVGWRDVAARLPMQRDSLFRIASMTKPITSTAALMLCEEGRFALRDPISRWAPEFATMRVLRSPNGPLAETVPADHVRRPADSAGGLHVRRLSEWSDRQGVCGRIGRRYRFRRDSRRMDRSARRFAVDRPARSCFPLRPLDRSARAATNALA